MGQSTITLVAQSANPSYPPTVGTFGGSRTQSACLQSVPLADQPWMSPTAVLGRSLIPVRQNRYVRPLELGEIWAGENARLRMPPPAARPPSQAPQPPSTLRLAALLLAALLLA